MSNFPIQIPPDATETEQLLIEAVFILCGAIFTEKVIGTVTGQYKQGEIMNTGVDLAGDKVSQAFGNQPLEAGDVMAWFEDFLKANRSTPPAD